MAKKTTPETNVPSERINTPRTFIKMWLKDHLYIFYIILGLLLICGIFFGVRYFKNASHPITRFMNASSKDFSSSFSFELEAQKNGETVMEYSGSYAADPSKQNLKAVYDADYGDYTFTGAVYSEGNTRINGNYYDGKWRVRDCSDKVINFFDFHTDYQKGQFDAASFLRFTELTFQFSPDELVKFMQLFKTRMDGNSPLAKLDITSEGSDKTYTFNIDMGEFFDMVRENGASVFYSVIEYDTFCALYEANEDIAGKADAVFRYTINGSGYLTDLYLSLEANGDEFSLHCTMDDFGSADPEIPQEFFEAEVIE